MDPQDPQGIKCMILWQDFFFLLSIGGGGLER